MQVLEELMQKLKNGQQSAFDEIYKLTYKSVFAICFSYLHDYSEAENMMQDTFMTVLKKIKKYKTNNPNGWINTIAKNLCLNYLKKKRNEKLVDISEYEKFVGYTDHKSSNTFIIKLAEELLSEREQKIVFMHNLGSMKLKEIAALLIYQKVLVGIFIMRH